MQQTPSHGLHSAPGAFQPQEIAPPQLGLGVVEFLLRHALIRQLLQLPADLLQHLFPILGGYPGVDAEGAAPHIAVGEGINGVGHAHLLPDLLKQPGRHAAPQHRAQHRLGVSVSRAVGNARETQAQVELLRVLVLHLNLPLTQRFAGDFRRCPRVLPIPEELLHQRLHQRRVIIAAQGHHRVLGAIMLPPVVEQILPAVGGDQFGRAQDGHPQGLIPEHGLAQQVVHQILRGILVHADFLQDHPTLLGKLPCIQGGVDGQVRQHIHRQGQILINDLGIQAGAVLAGKGVQLTAHRIHFLGNLPGGAVSGALEHHVLQEVGQTVFRRGLHHGAYPEPYPDGYGAEIGQPLPYNAQTVGQHPPVVQALLIHEIHLLFQYFSDFADRGLTSAGASKRHQTIIKPREALEGSQTLQP